MTLPLWGITSISSLAFNDCTGLTEFTLPASITSIGQRAFYYCDKLQHLYVHSTTPTNYNPGSEAFSNINRGSNGCTLHVPTGCTAAYAEDATFKVFTQVEEYDAPYVIAYDLYIAGTRVTSENAADILGDNAVSYDASTNTLTISGDITATGSSGIYAEFLDDIKIVVATPATIKGDLFFYGVGNVTITGSPTLTIIGSINAQSSWESFIISNANIDITGSITSQNSNIPLMIQSSTIILHQSGGYRSDNITSWADLILTDCYIRDCRLILLV